MHPWLWHINPIWAAFLLARVGEDDDGPVVVLVCIFLDQVDEVGVLHLLWSEDVPLVQLLHCTCPDNNNGTFSTQETAQQHWRWQELWSHMVLNVGVKRSLTNWPLWCTSLEQATHSDVLSQKKGLFMAMFFSSCSVSVSVALNSSVCRLAGRIPRITSRSLVKSAQPCSSSLSASSKICDTHTHTWLN